MKFHNQTDINVDQRSMIKRTDKDFFFKSSGRMALLITLFLVLINIFNNITTNSPKAEGLTAIEIWMLACILFVFGMYPVFIYFKMKLTTEQLLS